MTDVDACLIIDESRNNLNVATCHVVAELAKAKTQNATLQRVLDAERHTKTSVVAHRDDMFRQLSAANSRATGWAESAKRLTDEKECLLAAKQASDDLSAIFDEENGRLKSELVLCRENRRAWVKSYQEDNDRLSTNNGWTLLAAILGWTAALAFFVKWLSS